MIIPLKVHVIVFKKVICKGYRGVFISRAALRTYSGIKRLVYPVIAYVEFAAAVPKRNCVTVANRSEFNSAYIAYFTVCNRYIRIFFQSRNGAVARIFQAQVIYRNV